MIEADNPYPSSWDAFQLLKQKASGWKRMPRLANVAERACRTVDYDPGNKIFYIEEKIASSPGQNDTVANMASTETGFVADQLQKALQERRCHELAPVLGYNVPAGFVGLTHYEPSGICFNKAFAVSEVEGRRLIDVKRDKTLDENYRKQVVQDGLTESHAVSFALLDDDRGFNNMFLQNGGQYDLVHSSDVLLRNDLQYNFVHIDFEYATAFDHGPTKKSPHQIHQMVMLKSEMLGSPVDWQGVDQRLNLMTRGLENSSDVTEDERQKILSNIACGVRYARNRY